MTREQQQIADKALARKAAIILADRYVDGMRETGMKFDEPGWALLRNGFVAGYVAATIAVLEQFEEARHGK